MNRQKELAKNTIILTVGKICTQFTSFLLLPLYTSLLQPEEYGIVDLFSTYISLLVPLFNWQFENGLFRFLLDCRDNSRKQSGIFSTVIISNLLQVIIYLAFFSVIQIFVTSDYKFFLAVSIVLDIFLNTLLQFPRGLGDNISYTIASFISATSTLVLNVVFIAGFKLGAYGMFMAMLLSRVMTLLYLCLSQKIWRYFNITLCSKKMFYEIMKYSLPLVPNSLSWWVVSVSDRTIISLVLDVATNGVYSVANKFSSVFITFYNIFNMSWTEAVSLHLSDKDGVFFLTEVINSMFCLFSALCFGIIACMPFAFSNMINIRYYDAYQQIPILMIAVLFQVVVGLYSVIYVALKKSVEIARTSFYAGVINIVVDLLLIKHIGLYAASLSTLVAYASMAFYRYFNVKRYVDVKLDRKVLISTILVGMITLCSYYFNHPVCNVVTLIGVTIYALGLNRDFLSSVWHVILEKLYQIKIPKG